MAARQLMDPNPTVLKATATVRQGLELIMEHRYRNIPVVDDQGSYVGVFGVGCLLRVILPKAVVLEQGLSSAPFVTETLKDLRHRLADVEDRPVTMCMSVDVTVVSPDTELVETLLILYRTGNSIPVVEKRTGRLMGMISYFDVGEKVLAQEL
jgi:CBS domain-containing protein